MSGVSITTSRHLFIAGTGRAGTTFLVRYLTELGLDTHLSRHRDAKLDQFANAGLEDLPFTVDAENLPYVIKSPWLYECVEQVLTSEKIKLDGVIIPVRDLMEAAISRTVVERRAMHQAAPWLSALDKPWETWAQIPGGVVYSLNPVDQARLLAVSFYQVVERLVKASVPIIFLEYPRLVLDGGYLFEKLAAQLPAGTTQAEALAAHTRTADANKLRVGAELESVNELQPQGGQLAAKETTGFSDEKLEIIALRREVERLRRDLKDVDAVLGHSIADASRLRAQLKRSPTKQMAYLMRQVDKALGRTPGGNAQ